LSNEVTKDLSFEGYFKLPEKDPSLALRMTCILQRAVSYAKIIEKMGNIHTLFAFL